ncbi:hypothetical protein C8J56DRAFT_1047652 [Mycena floridula]|nr:hypothetical protein C8J56DRAFT_1047652 [Mycena floridula]
MNLLHWATVSPSPAGNLCAIRFNAPVRISSLRIFPTGAQPFEQCPEIIAKTEPESFYLHVFFNALPVQPLEAKEKRFPNQLVPSSIAYSGGQMDFAVDIGPEYATRLMIIQGQFECLSVAIYGDVISSSPPTTVEYTPGPLPSITPVPISRALDPANSSDPTGLARQLLSLIPDSAPLSLVVRLVFCMKPHSDDWDLDEFPYLFSDLSVDHDDFDLDKALEVIARPIPENVAEEALTKFAEAVAAVIGPKTQTQAWQVAKILRISASQPPSMALALCQHLDLVLVFDEHTTDESVMLLLLDAAANADIARYLNIDSFLDVLHEIQLGTNPEKSIRTVARRLASRIRTWDIFEDALSNTLGDFKESSAMLKDIGSEEQAIGIWIESMTLHDDLLTKLSENPVLPSAQYPPCLFRNSGPTISHDSFIAFVRGYIGVACVLAVLAWADSLPNDDCLERCLASLRLWQSLDGYSEIVNHLLLLRQLTKRLGWITSGNKPPRKSGTLGEQILLDLAKDPQAILDDQLVQTILALEPPLTHIPENERLRLRKAALVVEDGLPAAIAELAFSSDHPLSLRRLYTLRVSLAIAARSLEEEEGGWEALNTSWEEQSIGLLPRLVDILVGVANDLNGHFLISSAPAMKQDLVDQLFRTAQDLLHLVSRLERLVILTALTLRRLTRAVTDIFVCTDSADMLFSPSSPACTSAQGTRQTCLDIIRHFSDVDINVEPEKPAAQVVLKTLLAHATRNNGCDPAYHLLQTFTLIDHVLPTPGSSSSRWVTLVLPGVLTNFRSFFRLLDPESKVHALKRLILLDNDVIGIAEWLLVEELNYLSQTVDLLSARLDETQHLIGSYQITHSLHFLLGLLKPGSEWLTTILSLTTDAARQFSSFLMKILQNHYISPQLLQIAQLLQPHISQLEVADLRFALLVCCFRVAQFDPLLSLSFLQPGELLGAVPDATIDSRLLRLEIGASLSTFARLENELDETQSGVILAILTWLGKHENAIYRTLCSVSPDELSKLYDKLSVTNPAALEGIRSSLTVDEDIIEPVVLKELPSTLQLSVDAIKSLLAPHHTEIPSTPKRANLPDIISPVISPPAAILRSPAATGLTKTYMNNDFRDLRQASSARQQNTSRLPSMHVDVGIS